MTEVSIPPVSRTLDQSMLNGYAEASGDRNPIHTDESYAAATPLGGTIAHGMLVLSLVSEMMVAAFGAAWCQNGKLEVRFRAPARPGDLVTASAAAAGGASSAERQRFAVECRNQDGELLISGNAEVTA